MLTCLTNFAHTVQAVDRALIVDTLPSSDQADANAWAARMLGVGSVAGYFMFVHFRSSYQLCPDRSVAVKST